MSWFFTLLLLFKSVSSSSLLLPRDESRQAGRQSGDPKLTGVAILSSSLSPPCNCHQDTYASPSTLKSFNRLRSAMLLYTYYYSYYVALLLLYCRRPDPSVAKSLSKKKTLYRQTDLAQTTMDDRRRTNRASELGNTTNETNERSFLLDLKTSKSFFSSSSFFPEIEREREWGHEGRQNEKRKRRWEEEVAS